MAKILLVDDDLTLCHVVCLALEDEGHVVILAHDGKEGLEKILSETPDLIITDLMMPKMDGLMMLTRARRAGVGVPALLTTSIEESNLTYVPPKPYQAFLEKPFLQKDLIFSLGTLLNAVPEKSSG